MTAKRCPWCGGPRRNAPGTLVWECTDREGCGAYFTLAPKSKPASVLVVLVEQRREQR